MLQDLGIPLFAKNGYAVHELFIKVVPQTYSQWGYAVIHPDRSFSAFSDKVAALQYLAKCLSETDEVQIEASPQQKILEEDMTSSPSTSSLIS